MSKIKKYKIRAKNKGKTKIKKRRKDTKTLSQKNEKGADKKT
jgi:hypothetical protein